jgi:hypothetical protein
MKFTKLDFLTAAKLLAEEMLEVDNKILKNGTTSHTAAKNVLAEVNEQLSDLNHE